MKKLKNVLKVAITFMLLAVFNSCSKDPGIKSNPTPNPPTGGGNEQPNLSTNMKNISSAPWVMDSIVSVRVDSPAHRIVGTDCNKYAYLSSGSPNGRETLGNCMPNPGNQYTFTWSFLEGETKIGIGTNNVWEIIQLDATRFVYAQNKPDGFIPSIIWRTTVYARH